MTNQEWRQTVRALRHFPWLETARTLRDRFREDHLALTASSLTFTTVISLVPLFTVLLAFTPQAPIPIGVSGPFNGVWGSAANDVWAMGSSVIHWDGTSFQPRPAGSACSASPSCWSRRCR